MPDARILLGKPAARALNDSTRERTEAFIQEQGRPPRLAVLTVDDPAARSYLRSLRNNAKRIGVQLDQYPLPENAATGSVLESIERLNREPTVDGILVQAPLPATVNQHAIARALDPAKDIDGISPTQAGLLFHGVKGAFAPCTARAVIEILDFYNYGLRGLEVAVIGRSTIVGRPVGVLALARHATVTWCHTRTQSIESVCRRAEVLIVTAGRPRFVDMNFVRPGATVIDVGINVNEEGKLVGDVDADKIATIAAAYTPVPGGVGPVTAACLYANLIDAARARTSG